MSIDDGRFDVSNYEGEFIRALYEERARFVVVGGRAVQFYRPERATQDLDILVGFGGENLAAAIAAMGRVDPRYFRREWQNSHMRPNVQAPVDLSGTHCDVLTSIPGVEFESAWAARVIAKAHNVHDVPMISIDQLIENKRSDIGRDPKAAMDLALLTKIPGD